MEELTKKKRTRAGHKSSATRTVRQIEDLVREETPDTSRLSLLQLTLKEKLETIKSLDSEVIDLIEDEATLTDKIEQVDNYKESIYAALIKVDQVLRTPTVVPAVAAPAPPGPLNIAPPQCDFPNSN